MSIISRIFNTYKESLKKSLEYYENAYVSNAQNALQFYEKFLNQLLIDYGSIYSNFHMVNQIISKIEEYFQKREIPFVAIDGTCSRDPFSDFMVFFAAAYGVKDLYI